MSSEERGREVWIEKYRPQSLEDIHGQERIVARLREYVRDGDMSHMLFAGPAGVGKCVTGETPVLTDRGIARIGDVVGEAEGFADPRETLEVLTFTDNGEFDYVEPSHVFGKTAEKLVRVGTRDGNELTVTPEHKLLVAGHDGLEWKPAEALDAGERVVRPLRTPLPEGDGTVPWVDEMDGNRTLVHVTEAFAREHDVPAEEDFVGKKKRVVAGLRRGEPVDEIAEAAGTTRKTVAEYRRQVADRDLAAPSTVCSLSYLRDLDLPRSALEEGVTAVQYVNRNNHRSESVTPPWELTPALGALVGLAVSDARIEGGRIKFYNTDDRLLERFESAVEKAFGLTTREGEQQGVPYREIGNRTVTHLLESCFGGVDGATSDPGIGSALVTADESVRRAFLRAVFDAEAYVSTDGTLELTQENGAMVTLVSYLLAAEGVPSRRTTERKTATNSDDDSGEYHSLYVSGARAMSRFEEAVGFRLEGKAERLRDAASRDPNPNDDTVPAQSAVETLCDRLYLTRTEHVSDTLDPETPGRVAYLEGVDGLLDAASTRIERAQQTLERVDSLEGELDAVAALPAGWAGERTALEPLNTREAPAEETGVGTGRPLEYAQGRYTPTADRAASLLDGAGALDGTPPLETVREELRTAIEELGVPYSRVAEGTGMRGTDVINLLEEGHGLRSLPRFAIVAERVREVATGMLSGEVLEALRTLHVLTDAELYFDEVESVETVTEERRVYDLTVPGTHNYVAGAVPTVMHNTTSAVAIAKETYGDEWRENFLELNASDERGIDVVRDRIKNFARTSFGGYDYRIVFLDEADALCVPPGTEVVTGYPSSPEVKPIEEVDENGEPIPSVDFETNEIQSDEGRLVDSGVADFFELELTDGRTVTASLTHPFFVVGDGGELVEKELRELSPGDEIADFRDDVGVSRCETCGDWTAGRFCSVGCKNQGHGDLPHHEHHERKEFEPALVSDGGLQTVQTAEIRRIEYSHRGKAYNISMEDTPNFMLANGVLTHNTSDAQGALRRTMEQFSNNARFILSCNYSSRIIDPIQSRCAVFRFSPLSDEAVAAQVREIAADQGIELTDDGLDALVYAAAGDMRAAINGLQAASVSGGVVDEEAVFAITSTARPEEIREMVELALDGDFTQARSRLDGLLREDGIAGGDIIDQLHRSVWEFDLSDREAVQVMERVGEADYRITAGASEQIQLEALLASLATGNA